MLGKDVYVWAFQRGATTTSQDGAGCRKRSALFSSCRATSRWLPKEASDPDPDNNASLAAAPSEKGQGLLTAKKDKIKMHFIDRGVRLQQGLR